MEFFEIFKEQGFGLLIPFVVAVVVQSIKRAKPMKNDLWYIFMAWAIAGLLSAAQSYYLAVWNELIFRTAVNAGLSSSVWSYGKKIPGVKVFFEDKEDA